MRKRIEETKKNDEVQNNIIKLEYPIPVPKEGGGFVQVSQLTIGRLKAKHLKALPDNFIESKGQILAADIIPLLASVAEVPETSIDEMDFEDLMRVSEQLASFLEPSLGSTGKK